MDKWWIDQEADAGEAKHRQVVTLLFEITNYFNNWKVYHNHYMGCGSDSFFHNAIVLPYNDEFTQKISKLLQCTISKLHTNMQEIVISPFFRAKFVLFLGIFHGKFNDFF
jgi:hypothetical protein